MQRQMRQKFGALLKKIPGMWHLRLLLSAYRAPLPVILKNHQAVLKYKNKYKGKRCFIVGNGPSLMAEDLDKLENEICFAANRIYNIFSKTKWRPTFYCIQDENALREMAKEDIIRVTKVCCSTFIRMHGYHIIKWDSQEYKDSLFVPIFSQISKSGKIQFSKNADRILYDGNTVTYMAIQLAVYMGFKEIYLIGIDHNFPYIWTKNGELKVNDLSIASHFYDGAENNVGFEAWKRRGANPEITTAAYQAAEDFSRQCKKFRIYNATRGGKLEVFERVDLDKIIKN